MPVNEASVKANLVKAVKDAGGYARRIEDQYSVGMPDTVLIIPNRARVLFAEVKMVTGQQFGPTPRQYVELRRINDVIGSAARGVMVGWKAKMWYVHRAELTCRISDCIVNSNPVEALTDWMDSYG